MAEPLDDRPKASVYIDGLNLYRRLLATHPEVKWLDLEALMERLLPEFRVTQVRYFTAIIKALPGADDASPQRQQAYIRALESLPRTTVHLGKFRVDKRRMPVHPISYNSEGEPRTAWVRKTEEKGSDVALATYLLLDAFRGDSDIYVVLTNDSDLVMPLRVVSAELGQKMGLLSPTEPKRSSNELKQTGPSLHRHVTLKDAGACQLPAELEDKNGKIRRPAKWSRNSEGPAEAGPSNQ